MKNLKYLKYILRHKWYVMIECFKCGLYWRGITHDLSKFLPSEWFAYAEYFYGNKHKTEWFDHDGIVGEVTGKYSIYVEEAFNIAWNKHQKRNKHHWQYWVVIQDSDDPKTFSVGIPKKYLIEMLCDWRGAGKAISGKDDTKKWYLKNKKNMILRDADRKFIEDELKIKS